MPGVKKLHQESDGNTKPEYIFGHSCQAVAVRAGVGIFARECHAEARRARVAVRGRGVIRLYGVRFKIEVAFKQAVHTVGTFAYHFWMAAMMAPRAVWGLFGSWLRTVRVGVPPSERVVALSLRNALPQFLADAAETNITREIHPQTD